MKCVATRFNPQHLRIRAGNRRGATTQVPPDADPEGPWTCSDLRRQTYLYRRHVPPPGKKAGKITTTSCDVYALLHRT